jgi:hypothetical protein
MQAAFEFAQFAPSVRRTDPATSHAAAAQAGELRAKHQGAILDALRTFGPGGKSRISQHCWLDPVQVCRRLKDLHRAGLIRPTGRTVPSTAGRGEREWECTA